MNSKTAKLLRKYATKHKYVLKSVKRAWNALNHHERSKQRKELIESVAI